MNQGLTHDSPDPIGQRQGPRPIDLWRLSEGLPQVFIHLLERRYLS